MRIAAKFRLILIILSLSGVFLVLFSTAPYGIGTSPDSVAYISTARNLLCGEGYLKFDGSLYLFEPPLLPTLLAIVGLGGIDPFDAVRYVNAIAFGLIIFISGLWFLKNLKHFSIALLGSIAILLSIKLIEISAFAWTEPLFIMFVLLFIFEIERFLRTDRPSAFFLSAIIAALACLTRNVGLTVVLTGLVLLLYKPNIPFTTRLNKATIFGFISVLPLSIWLIRNYIVSYTLTGTYGPSSYSFPQNLYFVVETISGWFLPSGIMPAVPRILSASFLLILAAFIFIRVIRNNQSRWRSIDLLPIAPIICFSLI